MDDSQHIREYVDHGSQAAFTALVLRHIDWVYSVALRQTGGNSHRAEEATQLVFVDLAHKARSLANRADLGGWLYLSVRFAVARVGRAERRWQTRQQTANLMIEPDQNEGARDELWAKIRPLIDELLLSLGESDHEAIRLRFFQAKSFVEIGRQLRMSEDTVRKRVDRALDKLEALLQRRGVCSTATALGAVLATEAVTAAPEGLAAASAAAALSAGTGAAAVTFMSISKLAIGLTSAVAIAGGFVAWREYQTNRHLRYAVATTRAEADGLREANRQQATAAGAAEMQLERELAELRQRVERATQTRATQPREPVLHDLLPGMVAIDEINHGDRSTPSAALGSLFWAVTNGDIERLSSAIALNAEARTKTTALIATLPEPDRSAYASPEKLVALLLADGAPPLRAIQLSPGHEERDGSTSATARVLTAEHDIKTFEFSFVPSGDGWRAQLTADFVEKVLFSKLTSDGSPAAPH